MNDKMRAAMGKDEEVHDPKVFENAFKRNDEQEELRLKTLFSCGVCDNMVEETEYGEKFFVCKKGHWTNEPDESNHGCQDKIVSGVPKF